MLAKSFLRHVNKKGRQLLLTFFIAIPNSHTTVPGYAWHRTMSLTTYCGFTTALRGVSKHRAAFVGSALIISHTVTVRTGYSMRYKRELASVTLFPRQEQRLRQLEPATLRTTYLASFQPAPRKSSWDKYPP